jgi:hypothetical protein
MKTEIEKSEERTINLNQNVVVIARDPEELERAQNKLIEWASNKVTSERQVQAELQENYDVAVKNKWRSSALKRRLDIAKKMVSYYEKIEAALKAGYCIVPNFPVDVFAIRTDKKKPKRNFEQSKYSSHVGRVSQKTESPPLGKGEFVSDIPIDEHRTKRVRDGEGEMTTRYCAQAIGFNEPEFPLTLVKPHIMKDTSRAMTLKFFDEIGVLPERGGKGDPMVIGRVVYRQGYTERAVSFLISWWVDTREL